MTIWSVGWYVTTIQLQFPFISALWPEYLLYADLKHTFSREQKIQLNPHHQQTIPKRKSKQRSSSSWE